MIFVKKDILDAIAKGYTYENYRKHISKLVEEGKSTGNVQSDELLHYSKLNETRMNRVEKTISLSAETLESLKKISQKQNWIVISESWCGDAAQIVPIVHKMAQANENIDLKIVLRDENENLMNHFLTNGAKSIPIVIFIDAASHTVINHWGPRPEGSKQLIIDYKNKHGVVDETAKIELQKWYLNDKGVSIQKEIIELLNSKQA
ncbi:MAG TPA: thioredoxin family protein [Flavobacterium sp.]|nr:thioredoxin family protein [Flavobacterium sp.]